MPMEFAFFDAFGLALAPLAGARAGLVLLGSSTWPGEETALLTALKAAREQGLKVSLLLVPRHAERREGRLRLDQQGHFILGARVGQPDGIQQA
mgnify:CR=1 FL=1